jgi:anti-sigma regulatory factor (Ser/Thr protein kinase)
LPEGVVADLELCVTELVTNGVRHSEARDGDVEMRVMVSDAGVRIEVGDRGRGFATNHHGRRPRRFGPGGLGLYIVDVLADRWGVERSELHWVWFEIDLQRAGARA